MCEIILPFVYLKFNVNAVYRTTLTANGGVDRGWHKHRFPALCVSGPSPLRAVEHSPPSLGKYFYLSSNIFHSSSQNVLQ